MQSKTFVIKYANEYYKDYLNIRNFFADYILELFSKNDMKNLTFSEWGIGGGHNMLLLSNYFKCMHGYEGSIKAVKNFNNLIEYHPLKENFYIERVNLAEKFNTKIKYDIVTYGFFAYVMSNEDLNAVKRNLLNSLNDNGYVIVFDFISRDNKIKQFRNTKDIKTYKRNLSFWLDYFREFDLVDYRLFDNDKVIRYKYLDKISLDLNLSYNDDEWVFIATFRKKNEN